MNDRASKDPPSFKKLVDTMRVRIVYPMLTGELTIRFRMGGPNGTVFWEEINAGTGLHRGPEGLLRIKAEL